MLQLPTETLVLYPAFETTAYGTVSYVTAGLAPVLQTTADKTLVLRLYQCAAMPKTCLYYIIYDLSGSLTPEHNLASDLH
jgi:hypothetical protein